MQTQAKNKTKRYESYKESGAEWLGKIPTDWKIESFKNILTERNEKNSPIKSKERLSLSIDKGITLYANKTTNLDRFKDDFSQYKLAHKNDLVFNSMNMIVGAVGVSKYYGCISPVYYTYYSDINNNYSTKFYEYLFKNKTIQRVLYSLGKGLIAIDRGDGKYNTLRLKVSREDLRSMKLPFPPLVEQKIIVNFLDDKTEKIDQAIDIKEQQINLLKERKQILIHKAITRGLNDNVKLKNSGVDWIGDIPEHWEVKRLKYVAQINYGISPNEKTYNNEGIGTVLVNGPVEYSKSDFGYTRSLKWTTEPVKFAKKDDLLFCLRGSTTGRLNICHQNLSIGRGCASIRAIENHQFIIKVIIALKDQIVDTFKGSTFPSITSFELNNYSVPNPPLSEQKEIAEYIETASQKTETAIALKLQEIAKLKEYKSSLINSVVTGKVKVC